MIHKDVADMFRLDKKQMLFYFTKADEVLCEMEKILDLYVCGGANMCFSVGSRDSTHDIDTAPSDENILRELSQKMQTLFPLPSTWLNPSGQIFITQKMKDESVLGLEFNNLKVFFLSYASMLVLKVLSGRTGEEFHDMNDTISLIQKLKIESLTEIDRLVMSYKPDWNNPLVMNFAEDALRKCVSNYKPVSDFENISEHLNRYLVLSSQKAEECP
jgi:hypothetical protein